MPIKLYQRGKVWHYRGTVAGNRLRGSCQTTDKGIAARAAAEIETRKWKCHFDGPQAVLTFAQAASLYRAAGKSTRFLDQIEDHFKETLVKDIKAGTIRQMAIDLYPGCSGLSRNRMGITPAQAVINHAAELELCQPIKVRRFKGHSKVKDPATWEWVQAFCAEASAPIGALAMFMFLTGARISEAMSMQWDDVNLAAGIALIRESKIGKERKPHLPAPLVAAMANIPRVKGRPVFVYRHPDDVVRAWAGAAKRARIAPLTPHCCRHGCITQLLRKGIDVKTVSWLCDILPETLVRVYAHAIKDRSLTDVLVGTPLTQADLENSISVRKAVVS